MPRQLYSCTHTQKMDYIDLAFFACICRGVKFYGIDTRHLRYGTELQFKREPTKPYDSNAVLVFVVGTGSGPRLTPLGHVAAGPAKWLSWLLLGPYTVSG